MTRAASSTDVPRRLLVVDDDPGQCDLLQSFLASHGFEVSVAAGAEEALVKLRAEPVRLVISDVRMPGMTGLEMLRLIRREHMQLPVLLVTAYADIRDAVKAMRDGAVSYLEKPIDLDELLAFARQACSITAPSSIHDELPMAALPADLVAESPAMRDVIREVMLVAKTESRVLITGPGGAGKKRIAELIHRLSPRCRAPHVRLNCAEGTRERLDVVLFGREVAKTRGAAGPSPGCVAQAEGGSLLLEEIGHLPAELQGPLLQTIRTGVYRAVGGASDRQANVRLLATSSVDLDGVVREGRFREDLYYWLNVIEIHVPPLGERRDDILPLATLFTERLAGQRPRFSAAAMACLGAYSWPGNLLELQNAMERASLMARGDMILPEHLPRRVREAAVPDAEPTPAEPASTRMEEIERSVILQTLRENRFNRSETARQLGISRRTLIYKLRRFREQGFSIDAAD